eukprot:TRINITY_DN7297_c1_g1_i2.p1 TRINITY_DN7297_c1_g1~~TRINITY_DN7297_c1_g1_i2.p1  ORF type:complete len:574 (+),score=162.72 TRINITY_DN7297_c1_g1_i2:50-1771(+)
MRKSGRRRTGHCAADAAVFVAVLLAAALVTWRLVGSPVRRDEDPPPTPAHPRFGVGDYVEVGVKARELQKAVARSSRLRRSATYAELPGLVGKVRRVDASDGTAQVGFRERGVVAWLPSDVLVPARPRRKQSAPRTPPPPPPPQPRPATQPPRARTEDVAMAEASSGGAAWQLPDGVAVGGAGDRITSERSLRSCIDAGGCWVTVRLPLADGGRYLGGATVEGSVPADAARVLFVTKDPAEQWKEYPYTIRTVFKTYLAAALDGKVSVDRGSARSFEHWRVSFSSGRAHFSTRCKPPVCPTSMVRWLQADGGTLVAQPARPVEFEGFDMRLVEGCHDGARCHPPWRERPAGGEGSLPGFRMLLFTTFKPLSKWAGHDRTAAERALSAYRKLAPFVRAVVFSEDPRTREYVRAAGVLADGEIEINDRYGVPTYRGMFARAEELATEEEQVIAFANGDILFTHSLAETLSHALAWIRKARPDDGAMLVGRRFNTGVTPDNPLESEGGWQQGIEALRESAGREWQEDAIDYFAVTKGLWQWSLDREVPAMVVGGTAFDNWVLQHALTHHCARVTTV